MAYNQDDHFAEQAISLARNAANYLEEAYQYLEDIKDKHLKEKTEKEIEKIIEFL